MIHDCFLFFDELDLLEIRLRTLDGVVDRFVLCEAPFTFRGKPKPLYFSEARERFAPWAHKITLLVPHGDPLRDAWENENAQRDFLAAALQECAPDDVILLSDADEIPAPGNVARRPSPGRVLGHEQRASVGYVNRIIPAPWIGTRSFTRRDLDEFGSLRAVRAMPRDKLEIVQGGWHFSYLGGAEAVRRKIQSYAHSELDIPYITDRHRIELDFASAEGARCVEVDATFPEPLRDTTRWAHLIWTGALPGEPGGIEALKNAHGCFAYVPSDAARVVAVTSEGDAWERAGRERFGAAFGGAAASVDAVTLHRATWLVIDGLERMHAQMLDAAALAQAGIVAYVGNGRSFTYFERVLSGEAPAAGRAIGVEEVRRWARAQGRTIAALDRLITGKVFVPWTHVPDVLVHVQLGSAMSFAQIAREAFADFLTEAFVATLAPPD